MFVRKMSGSLERGFVSDTGDEIELDRLDDLETEPDPSVIADAQSKYEKFLLAGDYSAAGDLLPFFARDFFHDSSFDDLRIDGSAMTLQFRATAWVDIADDQSAIEFDVHFHKVAWLSIEAVLGDYGEYAFGEIDGLQDRMDQASARFEGAFHSLAIETGWGAWFSLVFQSVTVVPVDRIQWLRVLRNPAADLDSLFGLVEPA
ncbi:MAG: hypothetical protein L6413_08110 [Coriobacteriia bacterium]|nr:hypothetical protein [Coriobacteriia bacterium]